MIDENYKRKLTAILSADVVGYSRLMGDNEAATVSTLKSHRKLIADKIQAFNGRVVDSPGDNILSEFRSIVDAVSCAISIQGVLREENNELPENRKMVFRIGVNLGDVIQDDDRIYGDGVNIAARVEGLADPGGVAISGTAFDNIRNKLDCGYQFSGEHAVKNIANPVRVYKILTEEEFAGKVIGEKRFLGRMSRRIAMSAILASAIIIGGLVSYYIYLHQSGRIEPASVEKMAYPLPEKPSIAVLPFDNMSNDPEQEYFSDGMTEDLITDLSQISSLFVIGRNSTFTYKGKAIKIRQVAEELGVRYVLEGSVRKAGDTVRINAQLIDATTGGHIWAKRYDGKLDNIFALQDKITQKIVTAMKVKLSPSEQQLVASRDTTNIQAYDIFLRGWGHYLRFTPEDFVKAVKYFREAAELDSTYGRAYAALALTYKKASDLHWNIDLGVSWIEARLLAREFLLKAMQNPTSLAHQVASDMNLFRRQHDEAISEAEYAMKMDSNDPNCYAQLARALIFGGRPGDGINSVNSAMRLDPSNPGRYLYLAGLAQFVIGELNQSVILIEKALSYNPEARLWAAPLAAAYANMGRDNEAKNACSIFKKAFGMDTISSTLRNIMYAWPFKDPDVVERFVNGIVSSGFLGHPSAKYTASGENRLSEEKIKNIILGQAMITSSDPILSGGGRVLVVHSNTGEAYYWKGPFYLDPEFVKFVKLESKGNYLIKDDLLCYQWQELLDGHIYCGPVFFNPLGTQQGRDEYLYVTDFDVILFSLVSEEEHKLVKQHYFY